MQIKLVALFMLSLAALNIAAPVAAPNADAGAVAGIYWMPHRKGMLLMSLQRHQHVSTQQKMWTWRQLVQDTKWGFGLEDWQKGRYNSLGQGVGDSYNAVFRMER